MSPSHLSALFCFTDFQDENLKKQYPVLRNTHNQAIAEYINKEIITELNVQSDREQEQVSHIRRKRDSKLERIIKHTTLCLNHLSQSPAQLEVASKLKSRRSKKDNTAGEKRVRTAVISTNIMQS